MTHRLTAVLELLTGQSITNTAERRGRTLARRPWRAFTSGTTIHNGVRITPATTVSGSPITGVQEEQQAPYAPFCIDCRVNAHTCSGVSGETAVVAEPRVCERRKVPSPQLTDGTDRITERRHDDRRSSRSQCRGRRFSGQNRLG